MHHEIEKTGISEMSTAVRTTVTPITVILGDLHGWNPRQVFRSAYPVPVTFGATGRFLTLTVRGEERLGAVLTPEGHPEPVVYIGGRLPRDPWTADEGWLPTEMPLGVTGEMVETDVLAVAWTAGVLTRFNRTVWLDRAYRPMERFLLPVEPANDITLDVPCRVLEASPAMGPEEEDRASLVVVVDDAETLQAADWQQVEWPGVSTAHWVELEALSRCVESVAAPLLGHALLKEVIVHDLPALQPRSLPLLPRDVRDGLEIALHAMP